MTYLKSRQSRTAHAGRKAANLRKEAARFKDGQGKARKAEYDGV